MPTENLPDINKLLDMGKPGLESCSCTQTPLQPKVERKQCAFLFFLSLFLTRPYGNISRWFLLFFFLKRGLYSSPTPFPAPSHQDTPFSCGRPSSGAYYSRIEGIT